MRTKSKHEPFEEVGTVADLSLPAMQQQLRRVRSNRLVYRTINSGASWVPISTQVEVADDNELASLNEMINGQFVLVTKSTCCGSGRLRTDGFVSTIGGRADGCWSGAEQSTD